jgi:aminopeptidase N
VDHISGLSSSLSRALCWSAAWDMVRDAELAARDYVALSCSGLPTESDINLVTATLRQAQSSATLYADPAWMPAGLRMLSETAKSSLAAAEPGGGFQLTWARQLAATARSEADLGILRGWLDGQGVPDGLAIDTELRWSLLCALVAAGAAGPEHVEAELDRDRTASGERAAAQAHALVPTAESKAETWRRLTGDEKLPNWLGRSLLLGFHHPRQTELTEPYVKKFFDVVDEVWATWDSEPAQDFVYFAYPTYHVSQATVDLTDAWLAVEGHPGPLRRLVGEGKDSVVRALKARARDAESA